ncbi:hypothetical protein VTN31DRAFT_2056 [Thermomyces dupontii]|uniref:uncharacterized protein n=1 Tax=Talaromyces thermophilus TaxID=28565 RepID=UPI003743300A
MALLDKFPTSKQQPCDPRTSNDAEDREKHPAENSDNDSDIVNPNFQYGVRNAQASLKVWTRNQLIAAYVLIWFIQFLSTFSWGVVNTLTPYVTSSFQEHSLTATTAIVAGLVGGLVKLPYAKLLDVWGRAQGFALMIGLLTIGLIMMAGCNNVQTYCAAQVFYWIGYNGLSFTITIFIADTSSLRNRAFMIAYSASPSIATTWAYGPATERILETIGLRWGLGIWAIVMPIAYFPLFALFYYNQRKAEKLGLVPRDPSGRTLAQSIFYYAREFDIIGLILISAGLALFLLALSLYSYQADQWRSPLIICFLIFGGLLVIAFCLYERYIAPVTFIPWRLMRNRTVFFTFTMVASLYMIWYIWNSYFYSMLIVVFNTSVSVATYIQNIYTVGSCFWGVVMGIVIRYNGRLKWQALYFGVPITILGVGLMIYFRQPDMDVSYLAMCMIFIAFGGGTLVICEQMTVMAVSTQQDIPAILAMEAMIASVGGSIGSTIAAAMWTGIFPVKLQQYLPAGAPLAEIYGDMVKQASYPLGSPIRDGINRAYGDTQKLMLITSTCLYAITWGSVVFWEDINVKNLQQKGFIF